MSNNYQSWLNDVYDSNDDDSHVTSDSEASDSGDEIPQIVEVPVEVLGNVENENLMVFPGLGENANEGPLPTAAPTEEDRSDEVLSLLHSVRENRSEPTFDLLGTLRDIARRLEEFKAVYRRLPHDPLDPQASTSEQLKHTFHKLREKLSRRRNCGFIVRHLLMSEDEQISTAAVRILVTIYEDGVALSFSEAPVRYSAINKLTSLAISSTSPVCHYATPLFAELYEPDELDYDENQCPILVKVCIDRIYDALNTIMTSPQINDNGEESRSNKSCTNLIHFSANYCLDPLSPLRLALLNMRALLYLLRPSEDDHSVLPSLYQNARPSNSHSHNRQRDSGTAQGLEGDRPTGNPQSTASTDPGGLCELLRSSNSEYWLKMKRILLDSLQLRRHRNGELMHLACLFLATLCRMMDDYFILDLFYDGVDTKSTNYVGGERMDAASDLLSDKSKQTPLLDLLLEVPHDSIASGAVLRCFVSVSGMDKLLTNQRKMFAILDYAVVIMDTGGPFSRTEALKVVQKLIGYGPAMKHFDRKDPIRRLFNVVTSLEWYSSYRTSIQAYCSQLVPQLVTTMHAYTAYRAILWLHFLLPKTVRVFNRSPTNVYKSGNLATAYTNDELQRAVIYCLPFIGEETVFPVGRAIHEHSIPGNSTGFILLLRLIRRLSRMSSDELDLYPNRSTDRTLAELLDILAYCCLSASNVKEILFVGIKWSRGTGAEVIDTSGVIQLGISGTDQKAFYLLRHLRDVMSMLQEDKNHMLKLGAIFFLSVSACRLKISELPSRIAQACSSDNLASIARKRKRTFPSLNLKNTPVTGGGDEALEVTGRDRESDKLGNGRVSFVRPQALTETASFSYQSIFHATVYFIRQGGLLMDLASLFSLDRPAQVLDNLRLTAARLLYSMSKDDYVRIMLAHMPTLQRDHLSKVCGHPAYQENLELHQDLQHYLRLLLKGFELESSITIHGSKKNTSAFPTRSRTNSSSMDASHTNDIQLPVIQWNNNDLNEIIYRHLVDKGYIQSAEVFKSEAQLSLPYAPAQLTSVENTSTTSAQPQTLSTTSKMSSRRGHPRSIPLPGLSVDTNEASSGTVSSDTPPSTPKPMETTFFQTPERTGEGKRSSATVNDSEQNNLEFGPTPHKLPRLQELQTPTGPTQPRKTKSMIHSNLNTIPEGSSQFHSPLVSRVLTPHTDYNFVNSNATAAGASCSHETVANASGDMTLTDLVSQYLRYQHQNCAHSQALLSGPVSFSLKAAGSACPAVINSTHPSHDPFPRLWAPDCVQGLKVYGYHRSKGSATGLRHYMYSNFSRLMEPRPEDAGVRVLVFTPEDSYKFYCLSNENECYFYNGEEFKSLDEVGEPCHLLNLSRDGRIIGIGGATTISLMNVEDSYSGACKTWKTLSTPCDEFVFNNNGPVKSLLNDYYQRCELWDIETSTRLLSLRPNVPEAYYDEASGQFSACDRLALFSGTLFDLRAPGISTGDGSTPSALIIHKLDRLQMASGGAFHPNEREIVCADYIFDLRNPYRLLRRVPELEGTTALFSNDGSTLLTIPRRGPSQEEDVSPAMCVVKTFDADTYQHIGTLQMRHSVGGASVDYNGLTISVTVSSQASYWSTFVYELGVARPDATDAYEEEAGEEDDEFFGNGSASGYSSSEAIDITASSSDWSSDADSDDTIDLEEDDDDDDDEDSDDDNEDEDDDANGDDEEEDD